MHKSDKKRQETIVTEMVKLHQERGAQDTDNLIAAGFSQDEISTCAPLAAQRIAENERKAA